MTDSDDSDGTDYVKVTHNVERQVRDDARDVAEWGELSEHVRKAYRVVAYGDAAGRRSHLKLELEQIREQKDDIRADIRDLQSELEDLERREARVEERLDEAKTADEKYEGHLESLETQLLNGMNVFPDHGAVERAANIGNRDPDDVIADLKERNPSVPAHAFKPGHLTADDWYGLRQTDDGGDDAG